MRSDGRIRDKSHEKVFRWLGGGLRIVIPGDLRESVLAYDISYPQLNSLYRERRVLPMHNIYF